MKTKRNKILFFTQLLTACLALTSCGLLDTEKDKELDLFETKVYIYAESCDKFTSKPDLYRGPSLNKMLNDISLQRDQLEKDQKNLSPKQKQRFEEIRDCILSKQFKKLKKKIAVDPLIYQNTSESSSGQASTSNKTTDKQEKKTVPFFENERNTIKAEAKKASEGILSLVGSAKWIQAQNIYNSVEFGWPKQGVTPNVSKTENVIVKGGDEPGLISGNVKISFEPRQDYLGGKLSLIELVDGHKKHNIGGFIRKNQFLDQSYLTAIEGPNRENKEQLLIGLTQLYVTTVSKLVYSKSIEESISSTESNVPAILGFNIGQDLESFLDKALDRSDLINWQGGQMKDSFGPCIAFSCMTKLFDKPMFIEFIFCPTMNDNDRRMTLSHWKVTFTPNGQGAFQKALNDTSEACKKSLDASDRARLLESLSKFGLRQVTDDAIQKNNTEALDQGLKMMQSAFQAKANRGNGSEEVNDVDRNFDKFIRSRSKSSQIYQEEGKTESDFTKIRLRSKERGVRMTTVSNPSKKLFFVMSESSYEEALGRMRENISMYRISDTRVFESKQKTGVEDTFSNDYLYKEVSISGGDESHVFKIETISTIVEFISKMQAWADEYKSKSRVSADSLNALSGESYQPEKTSGRDPSPSNQGKALRKESSLNAEQQESVPDKDTGPAMQSSGNSVTQEDFKQADKKLNEVYQRAMRKLSPPEQEKLKREQREWIREKESYSKKFPENALSRQVEMTNDRILVIERIIK